MSNKSKSKQKSRFKRMKSSVHQHAKHFVDTSADGSIVWMTDQIIAWCWVTAKAISTSAQVAFNSLNAKRDARNKKAGE